MPYPPMLQMRKIEAQRGETTCQRHEASSSKGQVRPPDLLPPTPMLFLPPQAVVLWPARPGVQGQASGHMRSMGSTQLSPVQPRPLPRAKTGYLCFDQKEIGHRERKSAKRYDDTQPSARPWKAGFQPVSEPSGNARRRRELTPKIPMSILIFPAAPKCL